MPDQTDIAKTVATWLEQFERALTQPDAKLLASLFADETYWRDVLALSWRIVTVDGADAVLQALRENAAQSQPHNFKIATDRTPPRRVRRAGAEVIEAIFRFETTEGRGSGVLRLDPKSGRAWTLLTALDEIKDHEEKPGRFRNAGKAYSRDFRGPNWLDVRQANAAYR